MRSCFDHQSLIKLSFSKSLKLGPDQVPLSSNIALTVPVLGAAASCYVAWSGAPHGRLRRSRLLCPCPRVCGCWHVEPAPCSSTKVTTSATTHTSQTGVILPEVTSAKMNERNRRSVWSRKPRSQRPALTCNCVLRSNRHTVAKGQAACWYRW